MVLGIILAAGKGKRFKSKDKNKTTSLFNGKPLLEYALELFSGYCDRVVVVVGAFSESVYPLLAKYPKAEAVVQKKRLGTGHAVQVALKKILQAKENYDLAFVGYGDHMMFYENSDLDKMVAPIKRNKAAVSLITCIHDPEKLAWGRINRDHSGNITSIVEEKVATAKQKKINELNAGFYCIDFDFLKNGVFKIKKTEGGECYFTDIVEIANSENKKVAGVRVPFEHVGIGVNTPEELKVSEELFKNKKSNN